MPPDQEFTTVFCLPPLLLHCCCCCTLLYYIQYVKGRKKEPSMPCHASTLHCGSKGTLQDRQRVRSLACLVQVVSSGGERGKAEANKQGRQGRQAGTPFGQLYTHREGRKEHNTPHHKSQPSHPLLCSCVLDLPSLENVQRIYACACGNSPQGRKQVWKLARRAKTFTVFTVPSALVTF